MKNKIIIFLSLVFLPLNYIIGKRSHISLLKNSKNILNNSTEFKNIPNNSTEFKNIPNNFINRHFKKRDVVIALASGGSTATVLEIIPSNDKEKQKLQQEITN